MEMRHVFYGPGKHPYRLVESVVNEAAIADRLTLGTVADFGIAAEGKQDVPASPNDTIGARYG